MWTKRTSAHAMLALLALVLGSVLAPLSHYAFMALSDAYAIEDAHAGHHAGHHPNSPVEGATWGDAGAPVITCDYASLFATFAAACVPSLAVAPGSLRVEPIPLTPSRRIALAPPFALLARGPPPAPVHA